MAIKVKEYPLGSVLVGIQGVYSILGKIVYIVGEAGLEGESCRLSCRKSRVFPAPKTALKLYVLLSINVTVAT